MASPSLSFDLNSAFSRQKSAVNYGLLIPGCLLLLSRAWSPRKEVMGQSAIRFASQKKFRANALIVFSLYVQERFEGRIRAKVIEVRVFLQERVARVPLVRRPLEPRQGIVISVHERISRADIVGDVMKMNEPILALLRDLDFCFGLGLLACRGTEDGLDTNQQRIVGQFLRC